jgi:hypothetical protein
MNTFLPSSNFYECARWLDRQRLGKQRIEAKQILKYLTSNGTYDYGWAHHPAVLMWRGFPDALAAYGDIMCQEWIKRGYRDTTKPFFERQLDKLKPPFFEVVSPPWMRDERLHSSHRAALLFKNPEWYGRFGWTEEPSINYFWPVREAK